MAIVYLKRAKKTPQTGTDETRKIVSNMLTKIETGGEAAALAEEESTHPRDAPRDPERRIWMNARQYVF